MPELMREFTNFTTGELTYHESVEGGEVTAQEMLNLRVDTHGALRQRHAIRAILDANEANITGVFAGTERLYFINANGKLYYRNKERSNQVDTEIEIKGRPRIITDTIPDGYIEETKLEGRISVINEYKDFDILTSEGEDQGYWIDRREDDLIAYPLGFNPPIFEAEIDGFALKENAVDGTHAYFYRFTYIRNARIGEITRLSNQISTPEGLDIAIDLSEEPFNNVESNPSSAIATENVLTGNVNVEFQITGLKFPNPDGLEQGIAIYRSQAISRTAIDNRDVTLEDEDLDFRLVGIYPPPIQLPRDPSAVPPGREEEAGFTDDMPEEIRVQQQPLRFDNDRMPATVKINHA